MFEMRLDRIVQQIVTHHLFPNLNDKVALYINFDVRLHSYESKRSTTEFNQSRGLHLLYHQGAHSSYVTVFSAVTASPFERIEGVKEWKHEVTHDSCWRDLRIFSDTYFDMAQKINSSRTKVGLKEIAPAAMNEHNSFAGIARNSMFEWVKVDITKDPEDSGNYRRLVRLT